MKILRHTLSFLLVLALFVSCSDDNSSDPTAPTITPPSSANVTLGGSVELSFNVTTPEGYQTASVTASNGQASITSQPETGSDGGNVIVSYTGQTAGAATVTLSVTDRASLEEEATVAVAVGEEPTEIRITDNITSDQTWEDGKIYILGGRISVEAGASLTIEGGTIIKGEAGSGSNSSALVIARDATLNANGTADSPIIFTSVADEITPEMVDNSSFGSPNLEPDVRGLWGGLIVLGNAPISVSSGNEAQIEGIPSSDENGRYGGDDPEDSSGSITYVTIRHGGTNIGEGNEINGLSLGGVGTGTTVENIEIVANQDDGVEWFGGTVNVSNVLVWNNGDDAIDTDQAWNGTVSNVVIANPAGSGFELDGPEGTMTQGAHTIRNASVYKGLPGELIDVDPETNVNMENIFFFGLATNDDGTAANSISDDYPEFANNTNGYAITTLQAVIPSDLTVQDYFEGLSDVTTSVSSYSAATVGADASVFSWTWASQSSLFPSEFGL